MPSIYVKIPWERLQESLSVEEIETLKNRKVIFSSQKRKRGYKVVDSSSTPSNTTTFIYPSRPSSPHEKKKRLKNSRPETSGAGCRQQESHKIAYVHPLGPDVCRSEKRVLNITINSSTTRFDTESFEPNALTSPPLHQTNPEKRRRTFKGTSDGCFTRYENECLEPDADTLPPLQPTSPEKKRRCHEPDADTLPPLQPTSPEKKRRVFESTIKDGTKPYGNKCFEPEAQTLPSHHLTNQDVHTNEKRRKKRVKRTLDVTNLQNGDKCREPEHPCLLIPNESQSQTSITEDNRLKTKRVKKLVDSTTDSSYVSENTNAVEWHKHQPWEDEINTADGRSGLQPYVPEPVKPLDACSGNFMPYTATSKSILQLERKSHELKEQIEWLQGGKFLVGQSPSDYDLLRSLLDYEVDDSQGRHENDEGLQPMFDWEDEKIQSSVCEEDRLPHTVAGATANERVATTDCEWNDLQHRVYTPAGNEYGIQLHLPTAREEDRLPHTVAGATANEKVATTDCAWNDLHTAEKLTFDCEDFLEIHPPLTPRSPLRSSSSSSSNSRSSSTSSSRSSSSSSSSTKSKDGRKKKLSSLVKKVSSPKVASGYSTKQPEFNKDRNHSFDNRGHYTTPLPQEKPKPNSNNHEESGRYSTLVTTITKLEPKNYVLGRGEYRTTECTGPPPTPVTKAGYNCNRQSTSCRRDGVASRVIPGTFQRPFEATGNNPVEKVRLAKMLTSPPRPMRGRRRCVSRSPQRQKSVAIRKREEDKRLPKPRVQSQLLSHNNVADVQHLLDILAERPFSKKLMFVSALVEDGLCFALLAAISASFYDTTGVPFDLKRRKNVVLGEMKRRASFSTTIEDFRRRENALCLEVKPNEMVGFAIRNTDISHPMPPIVVGCDLDNILSIEGKDETKLLNQCCRVTPLDDKLLTNGKHMCNKCWLETKEVRPAAYVTKVDDSKAGAAKDVVDAPVTTPLLYCHWHALEVVDHTALMLYLPSFMWLRPEVHQVWCYVSGGPNVDSETSSLRGGVDIHRRATDCGPWWSPLACYDLDCGELLLPPLQPPLQPVNRLRQTDAERLLEMALNLNLEARRNLFLGPFNVVTLLKKIVTVFQSSSLHQQRLHNASGRARSSSTLRNAGGWTRSSSTLHNTRGQTRSRSTPYNGGRQMRGVRGRDRLRHYQPFNWR